MVLVMSEIKKPALVVDGSGNRFFAGVLNSEQGWSAQITANEPPLESLFQTVKKVLKDSGIGLEDIQSFIYCEGPGSVLGLRLCAMAVETWSRLTEEKPLFYSYNSMKLTASALQHKVGIQGEALLISDWKKGVWNSLLIRDGQILEQASIDTNELDSWQGELFHLPARKGWQSPPAKAQTVEYCMSQFPELSAHYPLLHETESVELSTAGANSFQKWTAERHRAAT